MGEIRGLDRRENGGILSLFLAVRHGNTIETERASEKEAELFVKFLKKERLGLADGLAEYLRFLEKPYTNRKGKKAKRSARTINKKLSLLKRRIRLVFDQCAERLDMEKVKRLNEALGRVKCKKVVSNAVTEDRTLNPEEIEILLNGMRSGQLDGIVRGADRIALMVELMSTTGIRISECLGIMSSDLKNRRDYVRVHIRGKGHKERDVMVSKELIDKITRKFEGKTYLFEYGGGKLYNRCYISDQVQKAGRVILGRAISAHTLRHSFATNMLKKTKNLKGLSMYLGHSSRATTADLYIHDDFKWEDISGTMKPDI